jgi:hypothetical protein
MSDRQISLERLRLRLHGVSPQTAQEAISGLGEELARRLARLRIAALSPSEVSSLVIEARLTREGRDAAALRALIVERIVAEVAFGRASGALMEKER